jgi:type 1 fimbria pilin
MRISSIVIIASCLSGLALHSASALAASGEIVFSGSIVESTCNVASAQIGAIAPRIATSRLSCGRPVAGSNGAPQTYVMTQTRLSSSESDRVLKYFDTYVKAGRPDAADPTLLTQTYD